MGARKAIPSGGRWGGGARAAPGPGLLLKEETEPQPPGVPPAPSVGPLPALGWAICDLWVLSSVGARRPTVRGWSGARAPVGHSEKCCCRGLVGVGGAGQVVIGQQLPMQGPHPLLQALRGSEGKAPGREGRSSGEVSLGRRPCRGVVASPVSRWGFRGAEIARWGPSVSARCIMDEGAKALVKCKTARVLRGEEIHGGTFLVLESSSTPHGGTFLVLESSSTPRPPFPHL